MKKICVSLILSSFAMGLFAQAATVAAQSLKCGGYVSVDTNGHGDTSLTVRKVGNSTCQQLQIDSLKLNRPLKNAETRIRLPDGLGSKLVLIVDQEAFVLDLSKLTETQNLEVNRDIRQHQRDKDNRDAAIAVGGLAADAVGAALSSGEH